jgi:cell division protein FtsZ
MENYNNNNAFEITPDVEPTTHTSASIIKVIGVGGGGSNAARHMYNMGIVGVDFLICNTDKQALESNPIPVKIQLGESGLGAGAIPDVARQAALDSEEKIRKAIEGTKMLFITAGMGGGTGTGASPIVASIARDMGILTVGIVTFPFKFEQKEKADQAEEGIKRLSEDVDALIVIKNENLKSYYSDLTIGNAFAKVDDVLLIAAKSIAELITLEAIVNVDFEDVKTIMQDSGTALIGSGEAAGDERAMNAVHAAISSPLLDQNSIHGAEKLLFFISYSSQSELTITELDEITEEIENKTCTDSKKLIWGHGKDETLGDKVRVTVIATGLRNKAEKQIPVTQPLFEENGQAKIPFGENTTETVRQNPPKEQGNKVEIPLGGEMPDNNQLRRKSEEDISEYLSRPAYHREQELKKSNANSNEELSCYKASSDGLQCPTPSFLEDVVD